MNKLTLSIIGVVSLTTISWGQMGSTLTFNPGNGSLGDTYTSEGPGAPVLGPYVHPIGQTPTGEIDYHYQASPQLELTIIPRLTNIMQPLKTQVMGKNLTFSQ